MFAYAFAQARITAELRKLEQARWDRLTPEQQAADLRLREVRALEEIARNTRTTPFNRTHVHHHFF